MKKTLLYIAVLGVIVIPSVTFAAWYNPFSWFAKTPTTVIVPIQSPIQVATSTPEALPVPKPVITNTITVEDPKLQSQINTLIQQNSTLQTQLASLTMQYNIIVADNVSLKTQISKQNTQITTLQTPVPVVNPAQTASVRIGNPTVIGGVSPESSYPIYINNQSDQPIFITSMTYQFDLFNINSNVGQNTDFNSINQSGGKLSTNGDGSSSYTFLNPIILPANFTTTVYINTDTTLNSAGIRIGINDLSVIRIYSTNPNVTFKI